MLQKNPAAQLPLLPPSIGRKTHFCKLRKANGMTQEGDENDRKREEGRKGNDDSAGRHFV